MVICFDATSEAKRALDTLLSTKQFRDVSEAISMALMNYEVLQRTVTQGGATNPTLNAQVPSPKPASLVPASAQNPAPPQPLPPGTKKVPEIFTIQSTATDGIQTAASEEPPGPPAKNLPPKDWLFGQLNRFLPAKATCRALLAITQQTPAGITVSDAGSKISFAACDLGDYLRELDMRRSLKREDSFAAAFPSTAYHGAESRVRFGGQFVGNIKQGQLTGLPAGLKLIAHDSSKDPKLLLTSAGLTFALLPNPILDAGVDLRQQKLGEHEIQFLLDHITKFVAPELSAYLAVIDGIKGGATTPEKLDAFLCARFGLKVVEKTQIPNEITQTFLTTQRTGAISRMADLDLVGRAKTGIRVAYFVTHPGECFRNRIQEP
jgi:hypothetical protein